MKIIIYGKVRIGMDLDLMASGAELVLLRWKVCGCKRVQERKSGVDPISKLICLFYIYFLSWCKEVFCYQL